jgi:hypothetical protein
VHGIRLAIVSSYQEYLVKPAGRYERLSHGRKLFSVLHILVIVHGLRRGHPPLVLGRYLSVVIEDTRRGPAARRPGIFSNVIGARFWIHRWRGPTRWTSPNARASP